MIATNEAADVLRHGWHDAATALAADVPEVAELLQARLEMAITAGQLDERHLLATIQEVESITSRGGSPSSDALARRLRRTVYEYLLALDAARPTENLKASLGQLTATAAGPMVGAEEVAALGHATSGAASPDVDPRVTAAYESARLTAALTEALAEVEVAGRGHAEADAAAAADAAGESEPGGLSTAPRRRFALRRWSRRGPDDANGAGVVDPSDMVQAADADAPEVDEDAPGWQFTSLAEARARAAALEADAAHDAAIDVGQDAPDAVAELAAEPAHEVDAVAQRTEPAQLVEAVAQVVEPAQPVEAIAQEAEPAQPVEAVAQEAEPAQPVEAVAQQAEPEAETAPPAETAPEAEPAVAAAPATEPGATPTFVAPRAGFHIVEDTQAHMSSSVDEKPLEMPVFAADEGAAQAAAQAADEVARAADDVARAADEVAARAAAQAAARADEVAAQAAARAAEAVAAHADAVRPPEFEMPAAAVDDVAAHPVHVEPPAPAGTQPAGADATATPAADPAPDVARPEFLAWGASNAAADAVAPMQPAVPEPAPVPVPAAQVPMPALQPYTPAAPARAVGPPVPDDPPAEEAMDRGWSVRTNTDGRPGRGGTRAVGAPAIEDDPFENNSKLTEKRRRIEDRLRRKRCDEAAALLQEIAQETGGRAVADLAMNAGDRCRALGKTNAALNCYLAAARSDPVYEQPLSRLADICIDNQDTDLAVSYLERIARLYRFRGEDKLALRVYRRISTIAPHREDVLTLLMNAQSTGRLE